MHGCLPGTLWYMHTHYVDTISVGLTLIIHFIILFLISYPFLRLILKQNLLVMGLHLAVTDDYMYSKHTIIFPHILGDVTKSIIKVFLVLFHKWLDQTMVDNHRAIVGHW